MTTLANDLVSGALRLISSLSPGEGIPGAESDSALLVLNDMLAGWSAESLMPPCRTLENFAIAAGINSRTIGATGQLVTTRPDTILDAYLRDGSGEDTPLDVTMTEGEYNAIPLKTVGAKPSRLYYDPQFPDGVIYFDSQTDAAYTLYLSTLKPFNQFATINTAMVLPGEYRETIKYLLAERLAPEYGFAITPDIRKLIEDARKKIKSKNIKPRAAVFDPAVLGRGTFDVNSGRMK